MCDCSYSVLKNGKVRNVLFLFLLKDISRLRRHVWDKESKILADKLDKFPSKNAFVGFYWDAGKSIKVKAYKKNKFEKTRDYQKLN